MVACFIANWLETLLIKIEFASLSALSLGKYCVIHIILIKKVKPKAYKLFEYKKRLFMLAIVKPISLSYD